MNSKQISFSLMARWARILGVLSVCTILVFFVSIPLGALGIILALLSRSDRLTKKAKNGVILCITGIVLSIFITTVSVVSTISAYGGWEPFVAAYEDYLGEYLQAKGYDPADLGISYDDTI